MPAMTASAPQRRDVITVWVPGTPRATQSGSVVRVQRPGRKDRLVPLRRGTAWARTCKAEAIRQYRGAPLHGEVWASLVFHLRRPKKSHPVAPMTKRPDVDGLSKGLLDAWNGVLWCDDAQITRLTLVKIYSDTPGVTVEVRAITPVAP